MNAAYLDADEGSAAVAAAAIVAAASDGDVQDLPEDVTALARDWKPEAAIVQLAIEALVAVAGSQSELASLWAEGDEGKSWRATLERLQERLHSR